MRIWIFAFMFGRLRFGQPRYVETRCDLYYWSFFDAFFHSFFRKGERMKKLLIIAIAIMLSVVQTIQGFAKDSIPVF